MKGIITFLKSDFLRASAVFSGGSLDVGIFGVPFVFAQSGFLLTFVLFIILAIMVAIIHIMLAEIGERTPGKHRLIGYARIYLGDRGKALLTVTVLCGTVGALVVYVLVAGTFLQVLFQSFGVQVHHMVLMGLFWMVMSLGVLAGLRTISRIEIVLVIGFFLAIVLFFIQGVPHIDYANFTTFDPGKLFFAWGVLLFAFFHLPSVSESRVIIQNRGRLLRQVILTGTVLSAVLMLFFAFIVVGVTGANTSQEAIPGMVGTFGEGAVIVGAIMGLIAISASFLVLACNLRDTVMYDWNIPKATSTILAIITPVPFFVLSVVDSIVLLGLAGIVLSAINGCCVILIHTRAQKKYPKGSDFPLKLPRFVYGFLVTIFLIGSIYSIIELAILQ